MTEPTQPNPGSVAARERGCSCPVLDNNFGNSPPLPDGAWYILMTCPLHGAVAGGASPDSA